MDKGLGVSKPSPFCYARIRGLICGLGMLTRAGHQFLFFQFFQDELIEIPYRQVLRVEFNIFFFFLFQFLDDDAIEFPDGKVRNVELRFAGCAAGAILQQNPALISTSAGVNVFHEVSPFKVS